MSVQLLNIEKYRNIGDTLIHDRSGSFERVMKDYGENRIDQAKSFVNRLMIFNVDSWNSRYPNDYQILSEFLKFNPYRPGLDSCGWLVFIKTLDCIAYQCSESKDWAASPESYTLKSLQRIALQNSEEYQKASGW